MVLLERKVIAWTQSRLGPMRVGPYGILQPVADAVKLMIKEDITPVRADRWVFTFAPIIAVVPAFIVYAVIPFGPEVTLFGRKVALYITDRSEEHTSELQSRLHLVCRLLLEKKKTN